MDWLFSDPKDNQIQRRSANNQQVQDFLRRGQPPVVHSPNSQWTRRDSRLKRITGTFEKVPSNFMGYRSERTHRPEFRIGVKYKKNRTVLPFLVDTGADSTMLSPRAAYKLLGEEYFNIDFLDDIHSTMGVGIGGIAFAVARPAHFFMKTDDGALIDFYTPVNLAEPVPDRTGKDIVNWDAPSLLGRDILRFFELHLDYYPYPTVELWYDERAARKEIERLRKWHDYLYDRMTKDHGSF